MKLLVTANSEKHLQQLIKKEITGVLIYIDKLSVNGSYYTNIDILEKVNFKDKEIYIVLNKLMHNNDLPYLREILTVLKNKNVKIMFYDMSVYNIAKELDMVNKLVIYQDHLNASVNSNNFYHKLGINSSYVTSDITKEELLTIKKDTNMTIMFTVYGYLPIFYSRRYLITNYLKYTSLTSGTNYEIISDENISYPISEEAYGTTVYTKEPVNLINYLEELSSIDYFVLHSNMISDENFDVILDKFLNKEQMTDCYLGFFLTKTIYKVK